MDEAMNSYSTLTIDALLASYLRSWLYANGFGELRAVSLTSARETAGTVSLFVKIDFDRQKSSPPKPSSVATASGRNST